jgi:hypothetical protein
MSDEIPDDYARIVRTIEAVPSEADQIITGPLDVEVRLQSLPNEDKSTKINLKAFENAATMWSSYGWVILFLMVAEVVFVNVLFYIYLDVNHFQVPDSTINVWLSATIFQVFGVVLVVTRHLFPKDTSKAPVAAAAMAASRAAIEATKSGP